MLSGNDISGLKAFSRKAAFAKTQVAIRNELAKYTAEVFTQVGEELYEVAHMNRPDQDIPIRYGTDEIKAVSLLFRIAGQIASATSNLIVDGQHYAAAALVRQIVEVEYLAWAFQSRDGDAERWLRSTADQRQNFFKPAKLSQAANGKFRGKDYGYHCELGGHPVPGAFIFFPQNTVASQLSLLPPPP